MDLIRRERERERERVKTRILLMIRNVLVSILRVKTESNCHTAISTSKMCKYFI